MGIKMSFEKTLDELKKDCHKCRFKVCKDIDTQIPCVQDGSVRALECIHKIQLYINQLVVARDIVETGPDAVCRGKAEVLTNVINQLECIIKESED